MDNDRAKRNAEGFLKKGAEARADGRGRDAVYFEGERARYKTEAYQGALERVAGELEMLDRQIRELNTQRREVEKKEIALKEIASIFDQGSFFDIRERLQELERLGIGELMIGEQSYPVDELVEVVTAVEEIVEDLQGRTDEQLERTLAGVGVTRDKIDETSRRGFREAMLACIKLGDSRAKMIDGLEARRIAEEELKKHSP